MNNRSPLPTATLLITAALALAPAAHAQQHVPFRNGIPVAPELALKPLPDHPVVYHTAEGQDIRVSVVAHGMEHPWGIAFLPDDVMLVTETHGHMRVIRGGVLDPDPVGGIPEVKPLRRSGLLDVALLEGADHDLRPLIEQPLGDAVADTATGSSDHGDFVFDVGVHRVLHIGCSKRCESPL